MFFNIKERETAPCGISEIMSELSKYEAQAYEAAGEIIRIAKPKPGSLFVVGCSTSEILGSNPGTNSAPDIGRSACLGVLRACRENSLYLCAQCCEHLNRAVICERAAAPYSETVNVVPFPKAGGSFATAAYAAFCDPVALEEIKADAGLDIGFTLIGMHLKRVAVPVRLKNDFIGSAKVLAARVRPKFIGGARAHYNEDLM